MKGRTMAELNIGDKAFFLKKPLQNQMFTYMQV